MNKKSLNTLMNIVVAALGTAGLALILLSVFSGRNTLVWGLLCVALGTLANIVRMLRQKKES